MPPGLQDLVGICETKEFKDYNACVDKNIPEWAPARIQKKFPNVYRRQEELRVVARRVEAQFDIQA